LYIRLTSAHSAATFKNVINQDSPAAVNSADQPEKTELEPPITPQDSPPKPSYGLIPIVLLAALLSVGSFSYFFSRGMTNCYGDGVAHVNIARKVVDSPDDSLWQRYMQIGSPWLPLQTALMLPLVQSDALWRTGAAGSLVSMLSFVVCAAALYLLARLLYRDSDVRMRRFLPLLSVAILLLNPGALYMQSTPMTELVLMAALVMAVYALQRWVVEQTRTRLVIAGMLMAIATLSRYEAWPVAIIAAVIVLVAARGAIKVKVASLLVFSALAGLGPIYWLWHNWAIYGDALEFLTGPNSARGIYLQNRANLGWTRIFVGDAALDFLTMLATAAVSAGPVLLLLALIGFGYWLATSLRQKTLTAQSPVLLLLVPFVFHVVSLYRGEIQIFPLSAFGLHNVRYGLPHLVAIAVFAPNCCNIFKESRRGLALAGFFLVLVGQYSWLVADGPSQLAVYQEGFRNGVNARPARERARMANYLRDHALQPLILMQTGALGPLVSQGGLRFSNIIHEGTARWHQIDDRIPADVSAVLVQEGDPLDERLKGNARLARDLQVNFEEEMSAGKIKLYRRR
jgi:dolichyl-phosphate-mannose-protein mannosyltransferase